MALSEARHHGFIIANRANAIEWKIGTSGWTMAD